MSPRDRDGFAIWLVFAAFVLVVLVAFGARGAAAAPWTDRYDDDIRRAVRMYWPDYPFPLAWKAQLIAESGLNPNAVSPVGAAGIAQFMPQSWAEVMRDLGRPLSTPPQTARIAIEAGAYFMAKIKRGWKADRTADDRHRITAAAYNAGSGNLIRAQRLCGGNAYAQIIACLPRVTGRHSEETIGYVDRIWRLWARLELGG